MSDTAVPTPPPAPERQPAAAAAPTPAPAPRAPGSASTLFWRRPDSATLRAALTAVIVAWVIEVVFQLLYVIEDIAWAIDEGFDLPDTVGDFFFNSIVRALFFLVPAFLALWQFLPIVKESTLATVLKRAAVAGVAGLAGLVVLGIFEAITDAVNFGFYFGYFSVTWLWYPIVIALGFTVQLLVGAAIAWIRANREPAAAAPAAPAATAPPAPPAAPGA